ncbi:MAG: phenylacetate--CoA ligase family protein [Thermoplasmatota archaeon]|jgi:phenylacetate-CoA ligase
MNQFYNPVFLSKILKSYLLDIDRLRRINSKQLRDYQNKQFRRLIKFALTVPMYHDKYKKSGININDIKSLDDIEKIPTVTKDDFKNYFPDGITSSKVNKKTLIQVSTSGTTGKKLTVYVDMFDIIVGLFGYIRSIKEHGINWRKDKLTIIADFAPHTVETGYINRGLYKYFGSNIFFKNFQWLNTNDPPEKIIKEIDNFKPDFIGGYVGMLGHLALLKEKGFGKNISPKVIAATGAPLSLPLKNLIEKSFNAKIFESYGSTESGPIAFTCKNGKFHVMSDFVYLEFFKNGKPVEHEEAGKLVVTKLYGNGTPIIRYDAINDIVAPLLSTCDCGLTGSLLKKIYGREDISIYTADGRILLPTSFGDIFGKILYELKTNKLKNVRIIQHSLTKIEIQAVIDENLREIGPSVEQIFSVIKDGFKEKIGSNVEFITKEVKNIDTNKPRIISKVDPSKIKIIGYD